MRIYVHESHQEGEFSSITMTVSSEWAEWARPKNGGLGTQKDLDSRENTFEMNFIRPSDLVTNETNFTRSNITYQLS